MVRLTWIVKNLIFYYRHHGQNHFLIPIEKYFPGKYISIYECKKNQGKNNFGNCQCPFEVPLN